MPTGYTAGIIEGTTKDFSDFIKICMRAFGAMSHMRDEELDTNYTLKVPETYHKARIEESREKIVRYSKITDKEIIEEETEYIQKRIQECLADIEKDKVNAALLLNMMTQAQLWVPPTPDHKGLKDFMIDQLEQTMQYDLNETYTTNRLAGLRKDLKNIDPIKIRKAAELGAAEDLIYHTEKYQRSVEACEKNNKWVEDVLKSIESKTIK